MMTKKWELFIVCALLIFGFLLRSLPFTNGKYLDDSPANRITFDTTYHPLYSKAVYDQENVRDWPAWANLGVKTYFLHAPLFYILVAAMAKLSTIPIYRLFYILIPLLGVWTLLQVYVIFRKYFGTIPAIIGLTLALFPSWNFLILYVQGFSLDIVAFLFVPAVMFFLLKFFETNRIAYGGLIGLLMGASFMTHPWTALFSGLNLFFVWIFLLFGEKIRSLGKQIMFALVALSVFLIISGNYLMVYSQSKHFGSIRLSLKLGEKIMAESLLWPRNFYAVIWVGLLLFVGYLISSFKEIKAKRYLLSILVWVICGYLLIFLRFLNIETDRTIRYLFLLIGVTSFFSGVGYSWVNKWLLKKYWWAFFIFCGLVGGYFYNSSFKFLKQANDMMTSLLNDNKWQAIKYMRNKTDIQATFFSLGGYFHNFQQFSERVSFNVDLGRDYTMKTFKNLCSGDFPQTFVGAYETTNYYKDPTKLAVARFGLASFTEVDNKFVRRITEARIEDFDYVVAAYVIKEIQPCINLFTKEIERRKYPLVYKNNEMAIYKVIR